MITSKVIKEFMEAREASDAAEKGFTELSGKMPGLKSKVEDIDILLQKKEAAKREALILCIKGELTETQVQKVKAELFDVQKTMTELNENVEALEQAINYELETAKPEIERRLRAAEKAFWLAVFEDLKLEMQKHSAIVQKAYVAGACADIVPFTAFWGDFLADGIFDAQRLIASGPDNPDFIRIRQEILNQHVRKNSNG